MPFKPFFRLLRDGRLFALEFYAVDSRGREALEAWLQMGVRLRLLSLGPHGYALHTLAKRLARPENDPAPAMVERWSSCTAS